MEDVLTRNPVELQPVYFSTKRLDHTKQPFVDHLLISFSLILKDYHLCHKILI